MTLAITPEQMEIYKRTARARQAWEEQARLARLQTAWLVAREAARMLKERFGARRVVAYGSLVHRTGGPGAGQVQAAGVSGAWSEGAGERRC